MPAATVRIEGLESFQGALRAGVGGLPGLLLRAHGVIASEAASGAKSNLTGLGRQPGVAAAAITYSSSVRYATISQGSPRGFELGASFGSYRAQFVLKPRRGGYGIFPAIEDKPQLDKYEDAIVDALKAAYPS